MTESDKLAFEGWAGKFILFTKFSKNNLNVYSPICLNMYGEEPIIVPAFAFGLILKNQSDKHFFNVLDEDHCYPKYSVKKHVGLFNCWMKKNFWLTIICFAIDAHLLIDVREHLPYITMVDAFPRLFVVSHGGGRS